MPRGAGAGLPLSGGRGGGNGGGAPRLQRDVHGDRVARLELDPRVVDRFVPAPHRAHVRQIPRQPRRRPVLGRQLVVVPVRVQRGRRDLDAPVDRTASVSRNPSCRAMHSAKDTPFLLQGHGVLTVYTASASPICSRMRACAQSGARQGLGFMRSGFAFVSRLRSVRDASTLSIPYAGCDHAPDPRKVTPFHAKPRLRTKRGFGREETASTAPTNSEPDMRSTWSCTCPNRLSSNRIRQRWM